MSARPAGRVVVAGLGNVWRRDDGVGPAVALRVAHAAGPGVDVIVNAGEPVDLLDAWRGADLAVVIDAMRSGLAPGAYLRIEGDAGEVRAVGVSGHVYPLPHVVDLARALNAMPGKLLIFAVEGADFTAGDGLSPEVSAAVEGLARAVLEEVSAACAP